MCKSKSLTTLDNNIPPKGWISFHEKPFFLGLRFPLLNFIGDFLMQTQICLDQLLLNKMRYFLCITLFGKEIGATIKLPKFNESYNLKKNHSDPWSISMSSKYNQGVNVMLLNNDRNWKLFFFFCFW